MKHCDADRLFELLEGALPKHVADEMNAHVQGCSSCGALLRRCQAVRGLFVELPEESERFVSDVMRKVRQSAEERPVWMSLHEWLLPVLECAFAIALLIMSQQRTSVDTESSLLFGSDSFVSPDDLSGGVAELSRALSNP